MFVVGFVCVLLCYYFGVGRVVEGGFVVFGFVWWVGVCIMYTYCGFLFVSYYVFGVFSLLFLFCVGVCGSWVVQGVALVLWGLGVYLCGLLYIACIGGCLGCDVSCLTFGWV